MHGVGYLVIWTVTQGDCAADTIAWHEANSLDHFSAVRFSASEVCMRGRVVKQWRCLEAGGGRVAGGRRWLTMRVLVGRVSPFQT
jgi:hypothetical protein